jgi:hypothetical protein
MSRLALIIDLTFLVYRNFGSVGLCAALLAKLVLAPRILVEGLVIHARATLLIRLLLHSLVFFSILSAVGLIFVLLLYHIFITSRFH